VRRAVEGTHGQEKRVGVSSSFPKPGERRLPRKIELFHSKRKCVEEVNGGKREKKMEEGKSIYIAKEGETREGKEMIGLGGVA